MMSLWESRLAGILNGATTFCISLCCEADLSSIYQEGEGNQVLNLDRLLHAGGREG